MIKLPGSMPATEKESWKSKVWTIVVDLAISAAIVLPLMWHAGVIGPVK